MQILDGKVASAARREQIRTQIAKFTLARGRAPGLAVVLVGDDPASHVYVANKIKACLQVGIRSFEHHLPATTSSQDLKTVIGRLNHDPAVDGILLQLPLPYDLAKLNPTAWIDPAKDADCLTETNLGRLWAGQATVRPCTPAGIMALLEHFQISVAGLEAVVIGRSNIVGKPMAHLMSTADATVTLCHSRTKNLSEHTRRANLVVVAAGQPEFLGATDFRPGAVVIDVGIHRKTDGQGVTSLCGDVRFAELKDVVKAATPVPGGVGPMTIAMLLENTLKLAEQNV